MMISLYRRKQNRVTDLRLIFDRSGRLLIRGISFGRKAGSSIEKTEDLGPLSSPTADTILLAHVERALALGFQVLYGYVPPGPLSGVEELLRTTVGIEVVPDLADGLPVWETSRGKRALRPSYLLFTVLSSETK